MGFYLSALKEAVVSEKKELVPSSAEFSMYLKMSTQGMVYRCLLLNMMLSGFPDEQKRDVLGPLVGHTLDAVVDHGLHGFLAIGKK